MVLTVRLYWVDIPKTDLVSSKSINENFVWKDQFGLTKVWIERRNEKVGGPGADVFNIYFPNGKFLKSYFLVDGIVTGTVDKIPDDTFYSDPQKTKDDDLDGVPNALDKCPNTPANTMVDPDGCPVTNSIPEVIIYPPLPPTFPLPGIGWHDPGPNFPIFNPDGPQGPGGTGTIPDPTIPTTLLD